MGWIFLVLAGICEVVGVTGMNMILRDKNIISFFVLILGLRSSFLFSSVAMQSLPMGTAYAIWTGIGTVGSGLVVGKGVQAKIGDSIYYAGNLKLFEELGVPLNMLNEKIK